VDILDLSCSRTITALFYDLPPDGGGNEYSRKATKQTDTADQREVSEELQTANGISDVLVEVCVGIVSGNLPRSEQFLPPPPGHSGKLRGLSGGEDTPLVERHSEFSLQFGGNGVGREPKRPDDIL